MNVSEFVYTTLCRVPPLRTLVNRIILKLVPHSVRIGNATIILNSKDPVLSAALALGVYEKKEIALMQQHCQPGQTVIDIGANVGLYTAIAGLNVGSTGQVIAFEPDPESFQFLQKTVQANQLTNVQLVPAAASNKNAAATLFTNQDNRGDHRLYQNEHANGTVSIRTVRVDDYLKEHGITTANIIKIDVQGFEGHVIAGMENIIRQSPHLTVFMEFWPQGLQSAGTDPLTLLQRLEQLGLSLHEIKDHHHCIPITDKNALIARLPNRKYANLLLLSPKMEATSWLQ